MSMSTRELVSLLQVEREGVMPVADVESRSMAQHPVAYAAIVDPHDETIEVEITEEMISLALEAVESEQVWPFCGDVPMVARAPRPSAEIIRFPGC